MTESDTAGGHQAENLPARRTGRFGDDKDPNMGKDTRFKPGQSGNPKGRPKGKSLSATIQEMLDDDTFIDRLAEALPDDVKKPDPDFQGTPMKAMITTAIIEAIDPNRKAGDRHMSRDWLAKYGYGTKVDVTSKGERISDAPKIISVINARPDDASTETEAS